MNYDISPIIIHNLSNLSHIVYELIIIVLLILIITNREVIDKNNNICTEQTLYFIAICSILFDYIVWQHLIHSMIFGIILFGYLAYYLQHKRQTEKYMKTFQLNKESNQDIQENFTNLRDSRLNTINDTNDTNNTNDNNIELSLNELIPDENIHDNLPDNIKNKGDIEPYFKAGDYNLIGDTLGSLSTSRNAYSLNEKRNKEIELVLEDRHRIPEPILQDINNIKDSKLFKSGNDEFNQKYYTDLEKKWNFSKYYKNCVLNGDSKNTINHKKIINNMDNSEFINNKSIEYCHNDYNLTNEQLSKIGNSKSVKGIDKNQYVGVFNHQFDIGGLGIIKQ